VIFPAQKGDVLREYRHIRTVLSLTICSISFVSGTNADEISVSKHQYTVVLLSLQKTDPAEAWPAVENRIQDELDISDISLLVLPGDHPDNTGTEKWFLKTADTYNANAVLMVKKTSGRHAQLIMLTSDTATGSKKLKKIPISIDIYSTDEAAGELVALKSTEAVRVELMFSPEHGDIGSESGRDDTSPPVVVISRDMLTKVGLATGVVTIAVGGALDGLAYYHANEANKIADWSTKKDRWITGYDRSYEAYVHHKQLSKKLRIGMITTYAVGGALTATCAIILISDKLNRRSKKHSKSAVVPTGSGVMFSF
jgi:hypothetical protein